MAAAIIDLCKAAGAALRIKRTLTRPINTLAFSRRASVADLLAAAYFQKTCHDAVAARIARLQYDPATVLKNQKV